MGISGLNSARNWRQAPHGPQKSPVKSAEIAIAENVVTPCKIKEKYQNDFPLIFILQPNEIEKFDKTRKIENSTKLKRELYEQNYLFGKNYLKDKIFF